MALVKCPRCGRPYSTAWGGCPACSVGGSHRWLSARMLRILKWVGYFAALAMAGAGALGVGGVLLGDRPAADGAMPGMHLLLAGTIVYIIVRVLDFWSRHR